MLLFGLGALVRRPVAGFVAAAVFIYATTFAMNPIDGIGFNGELASAPFALGSVLLGLVALNRRDTAPSVVWLYAGSGLLGALSGLCKQISILHLLPTAMAICLMLWRERRAKRAIDFRPLLAFGMGAVTPLLAVVVFYARAGHLRTLIYYYFTYNKTVYLGPVTLGNAIEQTYLFMRARADFSITLIFLGIWGALRFIEWLSAKEPTTQDCHFAIVWQNLLFALAGAFATFRFWDHYFVTVVPWLGLLVGLWIEEMLERAKGKQSARAHTFLSVSVLVVFLLLELLSFPLTKLLLENERRAGAWGDPKDEPISKYIVSSTERTDRIFVWGFAPEYYTSSERASASRYVYTTFVSGMVPWFENLTVEQEDSYAVPGSRETLIRELTRNDPQLIVDVPSSLRGRSLKRYKFLADFVNDRYCFESRVKGKNGRIADFYRRRHGTDPCGKAAE
jgi:hypothetical protein